ncbi:hypothetical protein [Rhodococcus qingshengii]|uniref:hypothetical protein n=1 Tax=Rhodococcus qingshengii TaxID=334542 RepID=UPI00071DF33D|nr:hypothetical protein [Rhodococcus qingshengii]KSU66879.1 hypothetical protein AS032_31990 [Rhodococcus qingshengii]SCC69721.1 hypothetical protein GA0061093_12948 [Rhodococcus qingshengii]
MSTRPDISEEILQARLTSFIDTLVRPEIDALPPSYGPERDRYVIGLTTAWNIDEAEFWADFPGQAASMTAILFLFEKLDILLRGQMAGYFTEGYSDVTRVLLSLPMGRGARLAKAFQSHSYRLTEERKNSADFVSDSHALDDFHTRFATILDTDSPEFREFIRLVLFASTDEWTFRIQQIHLLADEILRDPALALSSAEVDTLSWALSGADEARLYEDNGHHLDPASPIEASVRILTYTSRFTDLVSARDRLADIAPIVTADENTAAQRAATLEQYMSRTNRKERPQPSRQYPTLRDTFNRPPHFG